MIGRLSYLAKRRRRLTVRPQVLLLGDRITMTEPISVVGLVSGAFGGLAPSAGWRGWG